MEATANFRLVKGIKPLQLKGHPKLRTVIIRSTMASLPDGARIIPTRRISGEPRTFSPGVAMIQNLQKASISGLVGKEGLETLGFKPITAMRWEDPENPRKRHVVELSYSLDPPTDELNPLRPAALAYAREFFGGTWGFLWGHDNTENGENNFSINVGGKSSIRATNRLMIDQHHLVVVEEAQ